jgi:hypothetical protein
LQGEIHHPTARYRLRKYENYLERQGIDGYALTRFDKIKSPELEHIAPKTESASPKAGYAVYNEEFKNQYLDCLGNYLLISKSHNCSIGNIPFIEKHNSYSHSFQQREIQQLSKVEKKWTQELISIRQDKIITFVIEEL